MPIFGLFGQDFALVEGKNTFAKIGDFPVTGALTLSSAQNRLDAELKGTVCGAEIDLSFRASVSFVGSRVRLNAAPSGAESNSLKLHYSTGAGTLLEHPELDVHPDERIGLSVIDRNESAFAWLGQSTRLPAPVSISGRGHGALIHLDVRLKRVVHTPSAPAAGPLVSWQDIFSSAIEGPVPVQIGPTQELQIGNLWFDGVNYELEGRPNSGALFLHADLLDTSRVEDNEFLFQYAVVNGRLRILGHIESANPQVFWSRDQASPAQPAIVMFRHQDEHGHPIALVPEAGVDIPITYRAGAMAAVSDSDQRQLWDWTNAAMVIGPHEGAGDSCAIPCGVRAIDPLALYDTFADLSAPKNSLERPSFLKDGILPLADTPQEIHGLSRGAWLERTNETGIHGQLVVSGVERTPAGFSFHHTDLHLSNSADWTLVALMEERDVAPKAPKSAGEVGAHRFTGTGGELRVPAVDLGFALSNLAGPDRRTSSGVVLSSGILPKLGRDHLDDLEPQFTGSTPARFRITPLDPQRHVAGVRVFPPGPQPFARVLDELPTTASRANATGRAGPALVATDQAQPAGELHLLAAAPSVATTAAFRSKFVFGGEQGVDVDDLERAAEHARATVAGLFRTFERAWRGHSTDPMILALRKRLGISPRATTIEDPDRAGDLLEAAVAYVEASDNLDDITEDPDALLLYLADLTAEEFADDWAAAPEAGFVALLEHVWSPANNDLLRRIARNLSGQPDAAAVATLLFGVPDVSAVLAILDEPVTGLLTDLQRGIDTGWQDVVDLWATGKDSLLEELRAAYGPVLSRDVYARLLDAANATDAAKLVEVIASDLGRQIRRLGDLATDPPDYLFRTQRFPVQRANSDELIGALWSQCFDLCSFMEDKFWSFFLDDEASVVVKLTQKRSLADLLREINDHYRSADRPDPLALRQELDSFLETLDADLLALDWTGAFFVRPVADISRDMVLRDLAGFDHITASYVAVGGRKPASSADRKPAIDVWAHVFKQKDATAELENDPSPVGDVQLALTKFDVRIRQTQLSDANIEVEIHPQDVWGRKKQPADAHGDRKEFETIVLRGSLEPPGKDASAPRDLVFGAFFPKTFVIPIDLAFVKELALSSLRVARRGGATCIEIDGSLVLQNKVAGLDLQVDLVEEDTRLSLQDFRIQLPPLPGMKVEVGTLRKLGFDFPALRLAIPHPRAFNVFGIEMVPYGLGYIRGSDGALARLRQDYIWLTRLDISAEQPGVFVSYIELDVDFGKLPGFGLVDARGLRFSLALALKIVDGHMPSAAYLGISGLDARDLKIDLFGFLTLAMDRLRISPAKLIEKGENPANHPVDAGAILAEQIRLKILNWSPVPENARFDLLFLHPTRNQAAAGRKGMLAVYDAHATPDPGGEEPDDDKFFQVFWAVLAHNLELPTDVLNHLLSKSPGDTDPVGLLKSLIAKPPEGTNPGSPRRELVLEGVKLLDRESWLFGASFALGELFKRCNIVLHDQHYYGIHLWAKWVEAVFQQDSIELAYIPGPTRGSDRFRTNLRIPALDMLGSMKSGEFALEWAVNWDFLVDVGYPWRTSIGYDWFRAFSVPVGVYEGKFGFYFEKRSIAVASGEKLALSAGVGIYVGYFFGAGNSVAWVRAGIGVFAIMQGTITFRTPGPILSPAILKASIDSVEIVGVVGIFAYGEGGIDVWILSARFRVSAQAALECRILYIAGGPCSLSYSASLSAAYSASVRVGCGFCSWTFSVSGAVAIGVSGQLLLS